MRGIDVTLATRGLGVESLLSALPGVLVVCFALVTQLGDVWFLSLLVGTVYWFGHSLPRIGRGVDRDRAAVVVGLLLLSFTLITIAKPLLGLPRPQGAAAAPHAGLVPDALAGLYGWLSTASGYGFPSGHALGSTLVYGGLAWAIRVGSPRRRAGLAVGMITLISLSRLVLGLHFLVDVLAGAALGVVTLAVAIRLATPRRVFGLGAAIAAVGLLVVGPTPELLASTAAVSGALLTWLALDESVPEPPSRSNARETVVVGATATIVLLALASRFQNVLAAVVVLGLLGGCLFVAMPLLGERVAKNWRRSP